METRVQGPSTPHLASWEESLRDINLSSIVYRWSIVWFVHWVLTLFCIWDAYLVTTLTEHNCETVILYNVSCNYICTKINCSTRFTTRCCTQCPMTVPWGFGTCEVCTNVTRVRTARAAGRAPLEPASRGWEGTALDAWGSHTSPPQQLALRTIRKVEKTPWSWTELNVSTLLFSLDCLHICTEARGFDIWMRARMESFVKFLLDSDLSHSSQRVPIHPVFLIRLSMHGVIVSWRSILSDCFSSGTTSSVKLLNLCSPWHFLFQDFFQVTFLPI